MPKMTGVLVRISRLQPQARVWSDSAGESVEIGKAELSIDDCSELAAMPALRWLWLHNMRLTLPMLEVLAKSTAVGYRLNQVDFETSSLRRFLQVLPAASIELLEITRRPGVDSPQDINGCFADLPPFPRLGELTLSGLAIGKHLFAWASQCASLNRLECNHSQIVHFEELANFCGHSLEIVHLEETAIGDREIAVLSRISSLQQLFIRGVCISNDGLRSLAQLDQLLRLRISNTPVTGSGLALLGRRLKDLDLSFKNTSITNAVWLRSVITHGYGISEAELADFEAAGGTIQPLEGDEEGLPCEASITIGDGVGDHHLDLLAPLWKGEGVLRIAKFHFCNSKVSEPGWIATAGRLWNRYEPIVDLVDALDPVPYAAMAARAVRVSKSDFLTLCLRAEQLTAKLASTLDAWPENHVFITIISGVADLELLHRCRTSHTISHVELATEAQAAFDPALLDSIESG